MSTTLLERVTLKYEKHQLSPEDKIDFIELKGYERDCKKLKLDVEDQRAIRVAIMSGPNGGSVVPNTGGLRVLRFAPARWQTGKSGAARLCYVYFAEYSLVLLVMIYRRSLKGGLSADERRQCRKMIAQMRHELSEGGVS